MLFRDNKYWEIANYLDGQFAFFEYCLICLLPKIKKVACPYATLSGGAEGIRTLAPVARSNGLANRPLEPLGYCST